MDYQTFLSTLLPMVQEKLPEGVTANYRTVRKNNGVDHIGIHIGSGEEGGTSPVYYPEQLFCALEQGEPMEEIAGRLAEALCAPVPENFRPELFTDPDYVREHLVLRLVGRERNREMLRETVHRDFLDMAAVYGVVLDTEDRGTGLALLKSSVFPELILREEEAYELALRNSCRILGDKIASLKSLVAGNAGKEAEEEEEVYVLSNNSGWYGASALLYSGETARLSERLGRDLYILPSSVHEVILLPKRDESEEALRAMVRECNRSEVAEEEVLTDSLYLFEKETKRIRLLSGEKNGGWVTES